MKTRRELKNLWADKVSKLPAQSFSEILRLPRNFTCWQYREGIPEEEIFHRALTVDRATNDDFHTQYWSYEWDALLKKVVRLSKVA